MQLLLLRSNFSEENDMLGWQKEYFVCSFNGFRQEVKSSRDNNIAC